MNYIEVRFELSPLLPAREILYGDLSEANFESFQDSYNGVNAYIPEAEFSLDVIKNFVIFRLPDQQVNYTITTIPDENWNAVWESSFEPIIVSDNCVIRAPFHEVYSKDFEVVISPQMSFGTGHHETTFLMAQELLSFDVKGKSLLDMGCGTAVLAILANKLGAGPIVGIDIEEWAYKNALENLKLNSADNIIVEKGDSDLLQNRTFNIILANINKNVLKADMKRYSDSLLANGNLFLSGFFDTDIEELTVVAEKENFRYLYHKTKNNWAMIALEKY